MKRLLSFILILSISINHMVVARAEENDMSVEKNNYQLVSENQLYEADSGLEEIIVKDYAEDIAREKSDSIYEKEVTEEPELTSNILSEIEENLKNPIVENNISTWDCIWFGNYWQSDTNQDGKADNSDQKEPVKWRILAIEDQVAMLISDKIINYKCWNPYSGNVTWTGAEIRRWLNSYSDTQGEPSESGFYYDAFSLDEKEVMKQKDGDAVILLDLAGAGSASYGFSDDNARKAVHTDYAAYLKSQTSRWQELINNWWLNARVGTFDCKFVQEHGAVYNMTGYGVDHIFGIRPVISVDLSKNLHSYAGTVTSTGVIKEVAPKKKAQVPDISISLEAVHELTYSDDSGYGQNPYYLYGNAECLSTDEQREQIYEEVAITLELPEGLSFLPDINKRYESINLGNMSLSEDKGKEFSIPIYIRNDYYESSYQIKFFITANNYPESATEIHSLKVRYLDEFNFYTYRADMLTRDSVAAKTLNTDRETMTPADLINRELDKTSFGNLAALWEIIEGGFEVVDDITKLYDVVLEEKDIYAAIILNVLEVSTKYNVADSCEVIIKDNKEFLSSLKKWMKNKHMVDVTDASTFSQLTEEQQTQMLELADDYFEEIYDKDLNSLNKVFKNFDTILKGAECVETYIEKISYSLAMANLCESMKAVIREMYHLCPNDNSAMKLALYDCIQIINSSSEELIHEIIMDEISVVGVGMAKYLVNELWDDVKKILNKGFPVLDIYLAAYKAGTQFSNFMFNTDDSIAKYYNMRALLEYESLAGKVHDSLMNKYTITKNEINAANVLSSVDLLYSFWDEDCISAYNFVKSINDANAFRWFADSKSKESMADWKSLIEIKQKNYFISHESILTSWIEYLQSDYPDSDLYDRYLSLLEESNKRVLNKEFIIACPVDVRVYDSEDNLIAYTQNNSPYAQGDIMLAISGEKKIIHFYNEGNYRLECIGTDTGEMDVTVTEFSDSQEIRQVEFYNLPLEDEKIYRTQVTEHKMEEMDYVLTEDKGSKILPDYDSLELENKEKHKILVNSGYVLTKEGPVSCLEGYANEKITIEAFVANDYQFMGWISDTEENIFENSQSQRTTIRVPDYDISITAILANSQGEILLTDIEVEESELVLKEGEEYQTKVKIVPENASNKELLWKSENAEIASVDKNGKITALSSGKTTISVEDSLGKVIDKVKITVADGIWAEVQEQIYTGQKIKPEIKIYDGTKLLQVNTDYTISFKNNKNSYMYLEEDYQLFEENRKNTGKKVKTGSFDPAKAPHAIIKMKGNYQGSKIIYFKIAPVNISKGGFETKDITVTYNEKQQMPKPTLLWKGIRLNYGKDYYVVEYERAKKDNDKLIFTELLGEPYQLTIMGKNNFMGEIPVTLTISEGVKQIAMSKVRIQGIINQQWKNEQVKQTGYKLKYGSDILTQENGDYTVSWGNNISVGMGSVTFTGTGQDLDNDGFSYIGKKTVTFQISGSDIKKATVSGLEKNYPFTGERVQPQIIVSYKNKKDTTILEEDVHYTVEYENNINAGTASMIIKGVARNGYSGSKRITYQIRKQSISGEQGKSSFIVAFVGEDHIQGESTGEILKFPYRKGGVFPQIIVTDSQGNILIDKKDYTISYKNNKVITKADSKKMPTILIKGKGNYQGVIEKNFTIIPKNLNSHPEVRMVVLDKVIDGKRNKAKQSVQLYDIDGKKLSVGDYNTKDIIYRIYEVEKEKDEALVGMLVDDIQRIPVNTVIQVIAQMKGECYQGSVEGYYRILEKGHDIKNATIQIKVQPYTGEKLTITNQNQFVGGKVFLKNKNTRQELILGRDFEVIEESYVNNQHKGTAKVTFKGKGDFGGTKTVSFRIGARFVEEIWNTIFKIFHND